MTTLDIDADAYLAGLDRVIVAWNVDARLALYETAQDVRTDAARTVLVRTGATRRSGKVTSRNTGAGASATVSFGRTAVWQEFGTAPHVIEPRTPGGVLVFRGSDGSTVYTTRVQHPGTPPRPFLRPALLRAPGYFRVRARARFG